MFDASKLINELLGANASGSASGAMQKGKDYLSQNAGGIAGGTLAGGLAGYMMGSKKGRKMAKKAAQYGGLALVAGLAYKAYSDYQSNKTGPQTIDGSSSPASASHGGQATQSVPQISHIPQVPVDSGFAIEEQASETGGQANGLGSVLVSAMIAAAKADGQIDAAEHQAIFGKIEELDLSNDEKAFLFDQLNKPMDIDSLVASSNSQEQAMEIYIASLMAIEVDSPAEQAYLSMLAARLGLEPALTQQIHQTLVAAGD
ncbi:MAG: tellurite resistance TerB family protein [Cohaesibacter sp.]|nr:tellurite resistance TerB family protein [Cohaesibacter sp.]